MKDFFKKNGIEYFSAIPLSSCKVIKEYLLEKGGFDKDSHVIMMLIPYRSERLPVNISAYASVKDYHKFTEMLSKELELYTKEMYPDKRFKLFADHSPIDEVHAACISRLGFIGDNGLLINEKYSSFVFLAECITNAEPKEIGLESTLVSSVTECLHCGACANACPCGCIKKPEDVCDFAPKSYCLSAVTQKKGELLPEEKELMIKHNTVWGCDICQNVCPYTKKAEYTPIEFFKNDVITELTLDVLNSLDDESFKERPFSWRGRAAVERNVKIYEERKKS